MSANLLKQTKMDSLYGVFNFKDGFADAISA